MNTALTKHHSYLDNPPDPCSKTHTENTKQVEGNKEHIIVLLLALHRYSVLSTSSAEETVVLLSVKLTASSISLTTF